MLPGDFLLESSWNLAFQTMQLLILLHPVVIHCQGTVSVTMGKFYQIGTLVEFQLLNATLVVVDNQIQQVWEHGCIFPVFPNRYSLCSFATVSA